MSRTYYQAFGIEPTATLDEIKVAYRKLAKKYHPDLNPDDPQSTNRMKIVNAMYETLLDPNLRTVYDRKFLVKEKEPLDFSKTKRSTYSDSEPRSARAKPDYATLRNYFDQLEIRLSANGNQMLVFNGKLVTFFKDKKNGLFKYVCDNNFYGPFATYEEAREDCFAQIYVKVAMRGS